MKTMTIGMIGAGRIGQLHAANIHKHLPGIRLKTVADPVINAEWRKLYPALTCTEHYQDLLQDNEIQAVLICSPSACHAEQIIAAANAGKHIFCEKPIATDVKQIRAALQAVKNSKVKLQVGFNRRFDPNFSKVKEMVKTDQIGAPHLLRITSRDPKIPPENYIRASGGMFIDMTIHDFDMARYLMNSEIEEVYASANVLINPIFKECDDIDTAIINLKFSNGALGVIDNSRQAVYGYDQRVEVFGSKGSVAADNNKPTNTVLATHEGVVSEKPLYFFLERYEESFVNEMRAFYHAVVNDEPTMVDGDDGLRSVIITMAADQSRRENRPVKIDYESWGVA